MQLQLLLVLIIIVNFVIKEPFGRLFPSDPSWDDKDVKVLNCLLSAYSYLLILQAF